MLLALSIPTPPSFEPKSWGAGQTPTARWPSTPLLKSSPTTQGSGGASRPLAPLAPLDTPAPTGPGTPRAQDAAHGASTLPRCSSLQSLRGAARQAAARADRADRADLHVEAGSVEEAVLSATWPAWPAAATGAAAAPSTCSQGFATHSTSALRPFAHWQRDSSAGNRLPGRRPIVAGVVKRRHKAQASFSPPTAADLDLEHVAALAVTGPLAGPAVCGQRGLLPSLHCTPLWVWAGVPWGLWRPGLTACECPRRPPDDL